VYVIRNNRLVEADGELFIARVRHDAMDAKVSGQIRTNREVLATPGMIALERFVTSVGLYVRRETARTVEGLRAVQAFMLPPPLLPISSPLTLISF